MDHLNEQQQRILQRIMSLLQDEESNRSFVSTSVQLPPSRSHHESISSSCSDLNNSNMDRKKLFIGNLPSSTTLAELLPMFSKYGKVNEQLSVVKNENYAFIHYYDEEDAQRAMEALNNSLFNKRYIRVQQSNSKAHIKKSSTLMDINYRSSNLFSNNPSLMRSSQSVMCFNNGSISSSSSHGDINSNQGNLSVGRAIRGANRSRPTSTLLTNSTSLMSISTQSSLLIPASQLQSQFNSL